MLKRIDDWPKHLAVYIRTMANVPFKLGENDCGTFALGAVKAITGTDLRKDLGPYTNQAEEEAALKAIATQWNLQAIHVAKAQRGDVAIYSGVNGRSLMVVDGVYAIGPGENGYTVVNVLDCVGAYRIG